MNDPDDTFWPGDDAGSAFGEPPDPLDLSEPPDDLPPDDAVEPEPDYITPPGELGAGRASTDPNSVEFNVERTNPPPAQRHSPTSVRAGERIEPKAGTLRRKLLDAFRATPAGLTDEEGIRLTGMNANTYRPRRVELVEGGWVKDTGWTRPVGSGNDAVIWGRRRTETT